MAVDNNRVAASPTKEFFIYMLGRDIDAVRAIADLVDNSVDGARRFRGTERYEDLYVRLEVNEEKFQISDNCGGIPAEVARKYAFRFGRPPEVAGTPGSIGEFGVGMKRALFKMGKHFTIESTSESSRFVIEVSVDEWAKNEDDWDFRFKSVEENTGPFPDAQHGTKITVTELNADMVAEFALAQFGNKLTAYLQSAHQHAMHLGLSITLNQFPLEFTPATLLESDKLRPAYEEQVLMPPDSSSPVRVKLIAGIGKSNPKEAGWSIFCNGRMILEADKTEVTGWGENIAGYHNQYAMFRGYVFFDSDDPSALPWNTTKSAVNTDSGIYRNVRMHMLSMMRPVIAFLNALKKETANGDSTMEEERQSYRAALKEAKPRKIAEIRTEKRAFYYERPVVKRNPTVTIQFSRPREQVERAREALHAATNKEVGERVFDYFYGLECGD